MSSKLILYWEFSRGCQLVGCCPTSVIVEVLWRANSRNLSLAWLNNWSSVPVTFPRLRLFWWFHNAQITIENRVGSLFSVKINPNRSMKFETCFKLLWFHMGTLYQSSSSFGQRYSACLMSSWWSWQSSQLSLVTICCLTRFFFIGKEFLVALQTKLFYLTQNGKTPNCLPQRFQLCNIRLT